MLVAIILNYNDSETTKFLVSEIVDYKSVDKIIIVDNNSSDNSYTILKGLENKKIDVILSNENKGYASGNNLGIVYARKKYHPEYLVIANPDVMFLEKCIIEMKKILEEKKNAGAVTCRMTDHNGNDCEAVWKLPYFRDCLIEESFVLTRLFRYPLLYKEKDEENQVKEVDCVAGSFFMIRDKTMMDIGGFDERTFLYYEENILAYKLLSKGYKNYYLNYISYIHNHSISINKTIQSTLKKFEIEYESRKHYCSKYLNCGKIKQALLRLFFSIGMIEYRLYKHE